jgi:hypothetical protein
LTRRTAFLISNTAIVLISLLTGLRVLPGPDTAGMALAFYSLIVLPGILISDIAFGGAKADFEGIARIFLSGVTYACLLVCAGFIPGVSYTFIAVAGASVTVMAMVYHGLVPASKEEEKEIDLVGSFSRREDYSEREKRAMLLVFILLFGICAVLLAGNGETGVSSDAPDHISFIRRSLVSGEILPRDSFYIDGDGTTFDPRKGLWHPVVSLWAWMADASPQDLWTMIPAFTAFFAIVVFWFFAGELSGSIAVKALSLIFLVLFFRGDGTAWLTKLSYSRNISQIFFWGTAGFMIRYLRSSRLRDIAMAALAAFAGTAIHMSFAPVLAVFMLGLMIYVSVPGTGSAWTGRFWKSVPLMSAAVALPLAVRLINFPRAPNMIHTHMQGMMEFGAGLRMIDPAELISSLGLPFVFAALMIPLFPFVTTAYRRSRLVWVLFSVPAVLVLNPLTGTLLERAAGYMHFRLLYAAPAMVYLAMIVFGAGRGALTGSWRVSGKRPGWKRRAAVRLAGAAIFVFFTAVFLRPYADRLPSRVRSAFSGGRGASLEYGERVGGFLSRLPAGTVIASDPVSSYTISAFTDHFVTVILDQHCSPADTTDLDRVEKARDIFSPAVSGADVLEALEAYGATYLFVDSAPPAYRDFFGVNSQESGDRTLERLESYAFLSRVDSSGTMALFKVDASSPGPHDSRFVPAVPACADTPAVDAGELLVSGVSIDPGSCAAGDTVTVTLCWTAGEKIDFGLPLFWTIRFDTGFEKGPFYRAWYGKHYRRRLERSRGELYRYTVEGRVFSQGMYPDMWVPSEGYGQRIMIRVPEVMGPGDYTVRLKAERKAYIPNRDIRDYFLNDDSLSGITAGSMAVGR